MKRTLKITSIILCLLFCIAACSSSDDSTPSQDPTDEEGNDGDLDIPITTPTDVSITSILNKFEGTGLSYEIDTDNNQVIFTTKDLPNHTSPYWPSDNDLFDTYNGSNSNYEQNPNIIGEQNIVFTIPLNPLAAINNEATGLGPIGIARNGVIFFNQYAGVDEDGNPIALTSEIDSFDQWLGHPSGMDMYHYHIEPVYLTTTFGEDAFLGLLSDGFPVYGPIENGVEITNADLDDFHGHNSVTTDFPEGIYHYHITAEDPYMNGNGYYGTPGSITR